MPALAAPGAADQLAMERLPVQGLADPRPEATATDEPGRVLLTVEPDGRHDPFLQIVPLPLDATTCTVTLLQGAGEASLVASGPLPRLAGRPVALVRLVAHGEGPLRCEVRHDGSTGVGVATAARPGWPTGRAGLPLAAMVGLASPRPQPWLPVDHRTAAKARRAAGRLPAATAGDPATDLIPGATGSYVIITTEEFRSAAEDLATWKRQKGWPVRVATVQEIGATTAAIREWLRQAYAQWVLPPAYVLLVGDVQDVPAWSFSGNVSDQPYACVDGEDWLPDLLLGRLSVESLYEAQTVVNKTIAYERTPYREAGDGWFSRSLLVAGNYGSTTPVQTVIWCGEQLERLGFAPGATVFHAPPFYSNYYGEVPITEALEAGVSMVVYRGWARFVYGWEPPIFSTENVPGVQNDHMPPVVLSIVCNTGDFAYSSPCFGEALLRHGTPEVERGAVAFYGNGEGHTTTRFNDAMAYSLFKRVEDDALVDLGSWLLAGKLEFMSMLPGELSADSLGEASVEFYFHVYNLLGDPELTYWRGPPGELAASPPATLAPGADLLELTVTDAVADTGLAHARVGVLQGGRLLGTALSAPSGLAQVALDPVQATGDLQVTVTRSGFFPFEATVPIGDGSAPYLTVTQVAVTDGPPLGSGNGDGLPQPGEVLALLPVLQNTGGAAATGIAVSLATSGPATAGGATTGCPDLAGGESAEADGPLLVTVLPEAADGAVIKLLLSSQHQGAADVSLHELTVSAPCLVVESVLVDGDGLAAPGEQVNLQLVLRNTGSSPTGGGNLTASLLSEQATLEDAATSFGSLAPGESTSTAGDPLVLTVGAQVAEGTGLSLVLDGQTVEGYLASTSCGLLVGQVDIGIPTGPDSYGYYAYDSADIDYPDQRPEYRWHELSPTFGGDGHRIDYFVDTMLPAMALPFRFRFYGQVRDSIRVSDNGWISFDLAEGYDWWNLPLPHPYGNHSLVAPFWDNFDPTASQTDGVYWSHDPDAGTFTIQWTRMKRLGELAEIDDLETFQVVLRDSLHSHTPTGDGEILFLYKQVSNSDHLYSFATAGIEDQTETRGLQLTYAAEYAPGAAPLTPGLAVHLTTAPPVYAPLRLAGFQAAPCESGLRLSWQPDDARPVSGWQILRLDDDEEEILLTPSPLPGAQRSFLDAAGMAGSSYRLVALHPWGRRTDLGVHAAAGAHTILALQPCRPNPVLTSTRIAFSLAQGGRARLRIYDLAGRLVRTLLDGSLTAGPHAREWDCRDDSRQAVAAGIYLYRLETAAGILSRKLLLVR